MKQVLQSLSSGETSIVDVPAPAPSPGHLLIRTRRSLVSAGTERMLVQFGKAGLVAKARQQPDKVRMVLEKVRTDGIGPTLESVRRKLDSPLAMGYCNVGRVLEVGDGASEFAPGDRVVSNGKHAEIVNVAKNLCARIPDGVSDEQAVFAVIAAIGLQGIRLVQPTLGECVAVTGLGLVGLATVQLLQAHGCRVLGIDFDADRLALARRLGVEVVDLSAGEDPIAAARAFSRARGVDAVIIAASTASSQPVHDAAVMCRKRGRIVLVGVTGLELARSDFYEKELSFQVSCSYGPGRYDPEYEQRGHDYPPGFVRWTVQRNIEAVLDMLAEGRVDFSALVSHRFSVTQAAEAYDLLDTDRSALGIVLEYPDDSSVSAEQLRRPTVPVKATSAAPRPQGPVVSFVGAGNYAHVLIPAFRKAGAVLKTAVSVTGVTATHAARKYGFTQASTDLDVVFDDRTVDAVAVCTRHDSHADLVCAALRAGKHVFVEKPLATSLGELDRIETAYHAHTGDAPCVMVGFNRRFAPHSVRMKSLLAPLREPKALVMTVNAGAVPADHWTRDAHVGGGRIIGEACHFIDLLRFLVGSPITSIAAGAAGTAESDTASFILYFADGSSGTVHYFTNGNKAFAKERLEVFCGGRILQLDNFRRLKAFGWPGFRGMNLWTQDKGNAACAASFLDAIRRGAASPIPFDEIVEVSRRTIEVAERVRSAR